MELIKRWNEFCAANSYGDVIHVNTGFTDIIKMTYGTEISPQQAFEIAHRYAYGSYTDDCEWWWQSDNGVFSGAYLEKDLPIDRQALNAWCQEQGYETPWENEDE